MIGSGTLKPQATDHQECPEQQEPEVVEEYILSFRANPMDLMDVVLMTPSTKLNDPKPTAIQPRSLRGR